MSRMAIVCTHAYDVRRRHCMDLDHIVVLDAFLLGCARYMGTGRGW
jgi:hypothetical protein